jgi:hypothetical protein
MYDYEVIVWTVLREILRREIISALNENDAKQEILDRLSAYETKHHNLITARRNF